jgi:hypothetical protein
MTDQPRGEHAPIGPPAITGNIEGGWTLRSGGVQRRLDVGGSLQVAPAAGGPGWAWRHVSRTAQSTPWVGAAPTAGQAMLDADTHARKCHVR